MYLVDKIRTMVYCSKQACGMYKHTRLCVMSDNGGDLMKEALSKQEWIIMETLWKQHPMFLSEIMEKMDAAVNWQKSTYSTYLRKMCENGYLTFKTISGNRAYEPAVAREECVRNESRYMMSKLTDDSAKLFLTCMIREGGLSKSDKAELSDLIAKLNKDETTVE